MDKRVNDIIPPKESQGIKCKGKAKYTKIIEYFAKDLNTEKYNGLFTGGEKGKHYYIQIKKFNEIFHSNSFNFLDILYLFISCASSQQVGVLNFLLSDKTKYTRKKIRSESINFDNLNKDLKEYKEDIIGKRRLFTLAILSLIRDYFNTYEINKETETIQEKIYLSENEILLKFMFENIFNNEERLLNMFKKTKIIKLGIKIEFYNYIKNIVIIKTNEAKINNQINEVKKQILDCYQTYCNQKEQNKNWVKDFLNTCTTKIVEQKFENKQQKSDFLQWKLEIERLERENTILTQQENKYNLYFSMDKKITRYNYKKNIPFSEKTEEKPLTIDSILYGKSDLVSTAKSRQMKIIDSNSETLEKAFQNAKYTNTFQQNQQILQNLDRVMKMFGNKQGLDKSSNNDFSH